MAFQYLYEARSPSTASTPVRPSGGLFFSPAERMRASSSDNVPASAWKLARLVIRSGA